MATQTKKRQKEYDSDSETETIVDTWPTFLVVSPADPNIALTSSPFAVQKAIKGIAGEPKSVKRLRNGTYLVEVEKKAHYCNLIKTSSFAGTPCVVKPHPTLNFKKGVIRSFDLLQCSEEELKKELKAQGVCEVKRITSFRDGKRVNTSTVILTFKTKILPSSIKAGYLNIPVNIYIPYPMRCFRCQKFGHGSLHCQGDIKCARCGGNHEDKSCEEKACCANCGKDHPAFSRSCVLWIKEYSVQKIKATQNVSYFEARQMVSKDTAFQNLASFADTVKKSTCSVSTQTEPAAPITMPKSCPVPAVKTQVPSKPLGKAGGRQQPHVSTSQATVSPKTTQSDRPKKFEKNPKNFLFSSDFSSDESMDTTLDSSQEYTKVKKKGKKKIVPITAP